MKIEEKIRLYMKEYKPKAIGKYGFYAVLVPLIIREEGCYFLYEKRSATLSNQPGEICFPGGKLEVGEKPQDAAIRETCEELGIDKEKIKIYGMTDVLFSYANFTIFPFIGIINFANIKNMKLNKSEVEEVFLINLESLINTVPSKAKFIVSPVLDDFPYEHLDIPEGYGFKKGEWEVPVYNIEKRKIWGLTARITENIIENIINKII